MVRVALSLAAVGCVILVLPGCEAVETVFRDSGVADQLLRDDVITPAQHAALTGGMWGELAKHAINSITTLLIGFPLIRKWRGTSATVEEKEARLAAKKPVSPPG